MTMRRDLSMKISAGIVDSGASAAQAKYIHMGRCFLPGGRDLKPDRLGHGTTICDIIRHYAPDIRLYNAQVFDRQGVTSAAVVASAIDWLVMKKVDVINLSLGLKEDRPVLRIACDKAVASGAILVASSPAQGTLTYPAAYEGVIRTTGDARCAMGEISFLDSRQADFGGCPRDIGRGEGHPPRLGGASVGAAHISGQVAAFLQDGGDMTAIREWLISQAKYIHNEHRGANKDNA